MCLFQLRLSQGKCPVVGFFKESPHCLPQWLYLLAFPLDSLFSTLSPAFIFVDFFYNGDSDWCQVNCLMVLWVDGFIRVFLLLHLVSAGALSWHGSGPLHDLLPVTHLGFLSKAAEFWEGESQDYWRKAAAFAQGTGSKFGVSLTLPSSGQNQLHSSPDSRTRAMDSTFQRTWTHWEIGMDIYPLWLFSC